jgi:peptidoglycan-associated lipoprotein
MIASFMDNFYRESLMKNKFVLSSAALVGLCVGLLGCEGPGPDYTDNSASEYSYTAYSYTGDKNIAYNEQLHKKEDWKKAELNKAEKNKNIAKKEEKNNDSFAENNNIPEKSVLLFNSGKTHISADQKKILKQQVSFLKQNPDATIRIEGHADSKGKADLNKALSLKRAQAAANFLKQHGIDAKRIEVFAHDVNAQKTAGHDKNAVAQNRRVELIIVPGKS